MNSNIMISTGEKSTGLEEENKFAEQPDELKAQSQSQRLVFEAESSRIIELFYSDEPMTAYEILQRLSKYLLEAKIV